jgi:iron(III) transport system ATP-binding protein
MITPAPAWRNRRADREGFLQTMADIVFAGVSKRFGASLALDALSLTLPNRALTCLLGPSGCGKTTTLRLLAGFMTPDAGEIRIGGKVMSSAGAAIAPERRDMSMIFQSYALWPHRTIAQNVGYGLLQRGMPKAEIATRVGEALALVQLSHVAGRYPGELSGGQQQRVALARAVVVRPQTLLLDEPLSNLDANLREEMRAEIRRLHDLYGLTTVYVTHDQTEAMTTSDQIALLNGGRIEQVGSPEDIYIRPATIFAARFIGNANILAATKLDAHSVRIGDVALTCGSGDVAAATAVAIRPHQVVLGAASSGPAPANTFEVVVLRQSYTGMARDYRVRLAWGEEMSVTAPAEHRFDSGSVVWAHLPAAHCRALAA